MERTTVKTVQKPLQHLSYDLAHTAFFPLTGNPVGFHHLLLAECVLRQFAELSQIVFILSNGKHPDPTKEQAIAPQQGRLEIFQNRNRVGPRGIGSDQGNQCILL